MRKKNVIYYVIMICYILDLLGHNITSDTVLIVTIAAFALLCFAQSLVLTVFIKKENILKITDIFHQELPSNITKKHRQKSIQHLSHYICSTSLLLINLLMLEWLGTSESYLGQFVAITFTTSIGLAFSESSESFLSYSMFPLKNKQQANAIQACINKNFLLNTAWIVLLTLPLYSLLPYITHLYQISIPSMKQTIFALFFYNYSTTFLRVPAHICHYCHFRSTLKYSSLAQMIILTLSCYVLIPRFNLLGVVAALFISQIIKTAWCVMTIKKHQLPIKSLMII